MNLEAAEVELYLRKYQWALASFMQEIEEGCSFLETLSDLSVQRFLIYTQQLTTADKRELAPLIVKSLNRPALRLLGEILTQEEETRINSYRAALKSIPLPAVSSVPVAKVFAVKRADVAKTVLSVLSAAFASKPEKLFSLNWAYTTSTGDWQFRTELDFGGTWATEIRCYHRLVRDDGKSWGMLMMPLSSAVGTIEVPQAFSLLSLYGLSPLPYHINSAEDVQIAAQAILYKYNRLSQTVPKWINGLTIN